MNKKKYAENLAKFYLRYGRGNALLNFILDALKLVVYLGGIWYLTENWFGIVLPKELVIFVAIGFVIACYFIGYIDERIGFWKFQNNYGTRYLTPFFDDLDKKVDKILDNMGKKNEF